MNKYFFLAAGLLAGTIIGAGIFSLPYVFSRLGILTGFFYLILFGLVYFLIHFMYARLVEKEEGKHDFFYLASKYLPRGFSKVASFIILGELIFTLTVYLILAPTFAKLVFGEGGFMAVLAFWLAGSVFMFVRLSWLSLAELAGIFSILIIVFFIFIWGGAAPLKTPLFQSLDFKNVFLPFGPLLFALAGRSAISKVVAEWRKARSEKKKLSLKKVIFWGTAIPALIYLFFVISVLRLNPAVSPEALDSLGFLPPFVLGLLGALGLITVWTSYFIIGINVFDILKVDLKKPFWLAALVTALSPLLLYFVGFRDFLVVVSLAGGLFLALEGVFVVLMWLRAYPQDKWRWVSAPLFLIFMIAFSYQIYSFLLP